ncbi:MAG: tetratricopeptide repeat protein [Synergistaceae bacterium]|nr:tetratricopeptide repeat protein [Synergistaceae bacterium]
MEQDLFGWLNSQRNSQNAGLLVAPLIPEQQEDISPEETEKADSISLHPNEAVNPEPPEETEQTAPDAQDETPPYTPENTQDTAELSALIPESPDEPDQDAPDSHDEVPPLFPENQPESEELTAGISDSPLEADGEEDALSPAESRGEIQPYVPEPEEAAEIPPAPDAYIPEEYMPSPEPEEDSAPVPQDHEWQERATGFTLSLDEPPPELWTHINDDDPDPDYEPTDSLQGAAYVQIHGRNFTERLHNTLRHRKERAEERAQAEQDTDLSSPFRQMAVILCGTLIMALGFACLALWFVGRETPDGMKSRASSLAQDGKFGEAAEIYRRAYRRYPNDAEILAGLSDASRKAGHVQTAKAAHDEYIRLTSHDKPEDTPPPQVQEDPAPPQPEIPQKPFSLIINEKPLTFDDCLNEANHAYNIGMYSRALEYFSRAMKLNPRDFRPYIGLSASYRMKGWYTDSMHILDEARRIFGRSPALDMETYFLQEAK